MKKVVTIFLASLGMMGLNGQGIAGNVSQKGEWSTFHGFVEKMPVGLYGTWIINGRPVRVSPHSRVEQTHGLGTLGSYAEIRGIARGDTFHATNIQIEPGGKYLVVEPPDRKHENGGFLGAL